MIPKRHQVEFAKSKGRLIYPCCFCKNRLPNIEYHQDEHGIVIEFGKEGGVPQTCMAGIHGPTEHGDCKYIMVEELAQNYTRQYPSELFSKFSKEYYMEMITDIKANQPIPRNILIARAHKGYHTREQRINEMLEEGIITQSYHIDNEEAYSLTAYGEDIARAICEMMDSYLLIREHGELMMYTGPYLVFEWIRDNPNCTERQVYDHFGGKDDNVIPYALQDLVMAGYVEPLYTSDYSEIRLNVTQKGIDVWKSITG